MPKQNGGIVDLSIRAKDGRYPIPVYINDSDVPTFTLYFNPGDPFMIRYLNNLKNLKDIDESTNDVAIASFTDQLAYNLDSIFGDGSARMIGRYNDVNLRLLNALVEKIEDGIKDYAEKSEAAKKAEYAKAIIDSKKGGEQYRVQK